MNQVLINNYRLRVRNFYEVIEIEGEIVLVKTNLCSLFLQNDFEKRGITIVFLRKTRPCRVTDHRYSISIDE